MLLPGFQKFPAKFPKSKIFLRNRSPNRQEKTILCAANGTIRGILSSMGMPASIVHYKKNHPKD